MRELRAILVAPAIGAMALALVASASCGSFDAADSPEPNEGGSSDVTSADGLVSDDGGAIDAGSDASCSPIEKKCPGGGTPFRFRFDGVVGLDDLPQSYVTAGASVDVDPSEGACATGALRATAPVPSGGLARAARGEARLGRVSSLRLAFAFKGPKPVASTFLELGCKVFLTDALGTNRGTRFGIEKTPTGTLVLAAYAEPGDGGPGVQSPTVMLDEFASASDANAWRRFDGTFKIDVDAGTITPDVFFDGNTAAAGAVWNLGGPVGAVDVRCGISYADLDQATHVVWIDDVLFEACP